MVLGFRLQISAENFPPGWVVLSCLFSGFKQGITLLGPPHPQGGPSETPVCLEICFQISAENPNAGFVLSPLLWGGGLTGPALLSGQSGQHLFFARTFFQLAPGSH